MKLIYIVTTRGTIEKVYSEHTGSVVNTDNETRRYLSQLRLKGSHAHVVPVLNKDSLEITDPDRALALQALANS